MAVLANLGLATALVALTACSCAPGARTAEDTLFPFMEAVQAEDLDRLYCLCAGASGSAELGPDPATRRENFARWAAERYQRYVTGRDQGRVELDASGITLVKLFALGRGTFYAIAATRPVGDDGLRVETRVHFGYQQLDLSRLSAGTTFYLNGLPVGRVHPVRVPSTPRELTLEVLDSITVAWTLLRSEADGECPGGWTVASVEPVRGSETSRDITWVF